VVAMARSNAPLGAAMLAASTKPDPTPQPRQYRPSFGGGLQFQLEQQQQHPPQPQLQQQLQYPHPALTPHPAMTPHHVTNVTVPAAAAAVVRGQQPAEDEITIKEEPIYDECSNSPPPPLVAALIGGVRRASQRRDSDPKKDSGLKSGDVSDASLNNEDKVYSKLPPYLTTLPASTSIGPAPPQAATEPSLSSSSSGTSAEQQDMRHDVYDRLPGSVTGLSRR
jgi:hypothetical protein